MTTDLYKYEFVKNSKRQHKFMRGLDRVINRAYLDLKTDYAWPKKIIWLHDESVIWEQKPSITTVQSLRNLAHKKGTILIDVYED